jgi:uncharacterized membrane protein
MWKIFDIKIRSKRRALGGSKQVPHPLPLVTCLVQDAHMSVLFFGFPHFFSFGIYLCLIPNGFLTFFVRVACRMWSFWWPSTWRFTLKIQDQKNVLDCFLVITVWSSAQGGLNIV